MITDVLTMKRHNKSMRIGGDDAPGELVMIVAVHSADQDGSTVQQQFTVNDLYASEANMLTYDLNRLARWAA